MLSSYQSNTNQYFGFYFQNILSIGNPITDIKLQLVIIQNTSLVMLGIHVFHYGYPLSQVFYTWELNFTHSGWYFINAPALMGTSKICNVISFILKTNYVNVHTGLETISNNDTGVFQIRVTIYPDLNFYNQSINYLIIIIDNLKYKELVQLSLMRLTVVNSYGNPFSQTNFNVSSTVFGIDFRKQCFVGFMRIRQMYKFQPFFKFNLDYNGKVVNGIQNALNGSDVTALCIIVKICNSPVAYQFKGSFKCADCWNGGTITSGYSTSIIVPNCLTQHSRYKINYTNANITQTCHLCLQCQNHYYADDGLCQICNTKYPYCILCEQTTGCYQCNNTHFAQNGTCNLCSLFFPNCLLCEQKNQCTDCFQETHIYNITAKLCDSCDYFMFGCYKCTNQTQCTECQQKFSFSYLSNQCVMHGCLNIIRLNNILGCSYCSHKGNFILINSSCECKFGYFFNQTTEKCQQICGDGYIFEFQCDDGNILNGDLCNSQCKPQKGFICQMINQVSHCKYQIKLQLQITNIIKNKNNSALLIINVKNQNFPYQFSQQNFKSQLNTQKYVHINIILSQNPYKIITLESQIIFCENREIKILFNYDFDIEKYNALINFNTSKTYYMCQNNQAILNFQMKGFNGLLKFSNNSQIQQAVSLAILGNTILTNILLLAGLFTSKFIGLQCILTLQLIYFSQMLVQPVQKWPIIFQSLSYLKYSNGYNYQFQFSNFIPFDSNQRKLLYLKLKKLIIQNYNLSFLILLAFFLILIIVSFICRFKFSKLQLKQQQLQNQKNICNSQKKSKLFTIQKIFKSIYSALNQISLWSILQILNSFSIFIIISDKTLKNENKYELYFNIIQSLIIQISIIIVLLISFMQFFNFYSSNNPFFAKIIKQINKRSEQHLYKKIIFLYLIFIGIMIFFFNSTPYLSIYVALFHILYLILINFKVKPYKNSLKIHQRTIFLQHFIYLIFLILIILINFTSSINEYILIVFSYFTTALCTISIISTIFRLFYEYKYGQQLQLQQRNQYQLKQKQLKNKQSQKIKKKIFNMEKNAKNKFRNQKQKQRCQNKFLHQNQILKQNQQNLMEWIQKRHHLTIQQRQNYYYENYQKKPLNWFKKKDKIKYEQIIKDLQKQSQLKKKSHQKKYQNQQYRKLKQQLKNDFNKKRKQKLNDKIIIN